MRLSAAFSILLDLRFAVQQAFIPTVRAIIRSPSLLLRPRALSRLFMAKLWVTFGEGVDENSRLVKQELITPHAYGVVLDIGAGHGHTVHYLDKSRVTKYVALEPNVLMHPYIRSAANTAGYNESEGTLLVLSCGAEDSASIVSSISGDPDQPPVDTLISILTFCTVPSPEQTLASLIGDVLKPGGQLLFYEHVLSRRADVAWWQKFWSPIWSLAFDGCKMDRPTDLWIEEMTDDHNQSIWSERKMWGKAGEPEENLFHHATGRMVKRAR
ncbi:putative methyltransferase domain containing protein [Lyophyllum shimeji]|uniref:Methyltransferase domain containing protein n=1 Tax=Lyophyllum shimeji TaxID=47721 RepID=A0A9P3PVQ9_LYOSH|nr:putative methyltransferase domain containing protein [Lyophyllum shimeji]